jgi:hypothetical protein
MISRGLIVFLFACGGGASSNGGDVAPFIGVYATTSHTRAEMPGSSVKCNDPAPPVTAAAPYFRLAVDSFFMDPEVLSISDCTDAAATMCTETLVTLRAGGPGLQDESANTQTGGGVMCQLYFTHSDARLTGATVAVETLDRFDAPNISSSDCTLPRAQALASSPDCRTVERWTGTRQ